MKLEPSVQYVTRDKVSTPVEWTSLVVILVAVLGFFSTGCGDSPVAPGEVAEAINLQEYIVFQGEFVQPLDDSLTGSDWQAKKRSRLNIALVGDSGQPFFVEASSVLEVLDELYPQFDVQWIRYTPGHCEPGWCDDQRLYERLAEKGGWDPTRNYPGFLIWDGKKFVFLSPAAPMEVLQIVINNW